MHPDFHPLLQDGLVQLRPLTASDFAPLFAVAADPLIWEQHPHKLRWQEPVFRVFFDASLAANGALVITECGTGTVIGGTRFYEYDAAASSVVIGGTFFARRYWGSGINRRVKQLMLDHIFQYLHTVYFFIDRYNIRSQIAIGRLGALRCGEKIIGEDMIDYVYRITRDEWQQQQAAQS